MVSPTFWFVIGAGENRASSDNTGLAITNEAAQDTFAYASLGDTENPFSLGAVLIAATPAISLGLCSY